MSSHHRSPNSLLLTSFTTWKDTQASNSSDDLLALIQVSSPPKNCHFLRQLPVDFKLAPEKAIAHLENIQPNITVCCGMAETRDCLDVEFQAVIGDRTLHTAIDLEALINGLSATRISRDAGRFVCNSLYYDLLHYVKKSERSQHALFIHVPVLTQQNQQIILNDFRQIIDRLLVLSL